MNSVRRTTAVGAVGALTVGIAVAGLGSGVAGAATYPPTPPPTSASPTPTPTNPGTFSCTATAVNNKSRIRVRLTATGAAANYKDFVFKIQKKVPNQRSWRINNVAYDIDVNEARTVNREKGIFRAKCFGPANAAVYSNRVKLKR